MYSVFWALRVCERAGISLVCGHLANLILFVFVVVVLCCFAAPVFWWKGLLNIAILDIKQIREATETCSFSTGTTKIN